MLSTDARRKSEAFLAFMLVGFGTGWTVCDAALGNMAWLMRRLPAEGLLLPTHADIAGKATAFTCALACWVAMGADYKPSFAAFRTGMWALYVAGMAAALLMAAFWSVTVGDVAVFVILGTALGSAIGTFSVCCVYSFAAVFFDDAVVAAILTGNGVGSALAGVLGLVQGAQPAFGTTAAMLVTAGLVGAAMCGWRHILVRGLAMAPSGASPEDDAAAERPLLPPPPEPPGGGAEASKGWATLARLGLPLWLLAGVTAASTWGVALPTLQFATAHAGCDCAVDAELPSRTYTLATSSAFILMPLGALLAHVAPCTDLRALAALDAAQLGMLSVQVAAIRGAPAMRCSPAARTAVIVCTAGMRATDSYISTILYQLNARRFDGTGERLSKAAAFAMGQANLLPQLLLGTLMWVLVETSVVGCML